MGNRMVSVVLLLVIGVGTLVWAAPAAITHNVHQSGFSLKYAFWAFWLGGLSAISLLLGSIVGVVGKPKTGILASMTAFGAGALLAALTIELVAPTAMALIGSHGGAGHENARHGDPLTAMYALLAGSVIGGILFVLLDQLVNAHGGYLRKSATTITFLSHRRRVRTQQMLERLSRIKFLEAIPTEKLQHLVDYVRPLSYEEGEHLFDKGEEGDRMFFVEQGQIGIVDEGDEFKRVGPGELIGEISLLTGSPRTATGIARGHTVVLVLYKRDFERIRELTPELTKAAADIVSSRLDELRERHETKIRSEAVWSKQAIEALHYGTEAPTSMQIQHASKSHGGAPLAIWLGILLDGIPESFVIGAGFLGLVTAKLAQGTPQFSEVIPYTLIAGLFLSNFPEAMSSSVGMKSLGWSTAKILLLWSSLVVITAAGAVVGYVVGAEVSHTVVVGIEGLAAGAMLTMIAQTMIPEAVHLGGPNVVGLSTLAGFLGAIAFKLLEV